MHNNTHILKHIVALFSILVAISFLQVNASAAPVVQRSLSVVILGDSYSAGTGAGMYYGQSGSYRSHRNWGSLYASWLKTQGIKTSYTNLAYNGYTTKQVIEEQIKIVPENTNLVLMTVGGNDAKFGGIVERCFAKSLYSADGCKQGVNNATSLLNTIINQTETIFTNLESRLDPSAQIVLVGYPLLSIESNESIRTCTEYKGRQCLKRTTYKTAENVRKLGKLANQRQAEFVKKWNSTHTLKATFVDSIGNTFAGHEPNPSPDKRNNSRWINEFFETEGYEEEGDATSKFSADPSEWYHPNITGHQKIANQVIETVGIPSSAKVVAPDKSDIDVAFVIDTTASMSAFIGPAKQSALEIANKLRLQTNSIRYALVQYRDHGMMYSEVVYLQRNFTYDPILFASSVDSLYLDGVGNPDDPEAVYSGIMKALSLDWRPGVRKVVILIGDAPAKDPEPITGYTWQQVAQRAYDIDPVEIYTLTAGSSIADRNMQNLTKQSGGQILSADPTSLASIIIDAVELSTNKPFGWIQGPYVIKVGDSLELDARGSYAVDNNITKIEWDLDGDGKFETPSNDLLYTHTFTEEFSGTIGIRITDGSNRTGIGSTQLDVSDDGDSIPRNLDNCPDIANQNQSDYDEDGIGDYCDDTPGYPTEPRGDTEVFPDGIPAEYKDSEDETSSNNSGKDNASKTTDRYAYLATETITNRSENSNLTNSNSKPNNKSSPTTKSFTNLDKESSIELAIFVTVGAVVSTTAGYVVFRKFRNR